MFKTPTLAALLVALLISFQAPVHAAPAVPEVVAAVPPWQGVSLIDGRGSCPADARPDATTTVLALDGGGVRGIIPAAILAYVEARAGHPIGELFDVMSGVSTGSLIAASLAAPSSGTGTGSAAGTRSSAQAVAEVYLSDVQHLFGQSLLDEIETTAGVFRPKYDEMVLEALLQQRLGDVRLSQLRPHVIVPSFDLLTNQAVLFDSRLAATNASEDFLVREMLRAATAPPSIYPPKRLSSIDGKTSLVGVDAALFVNNPEILARAMALDAAPERKLVLFSLGTGIQATPVVDLDSNWGLIDWIPGMLQVVSYGQSSLAGNDSVRLLHQAQATNDLHYLRLSEALPVASINQFDGSAEHMRVLMDHATRVIADHQAELDHMIHHLLCRQGL